MLGLAQEARDHAARFGVDRAARYVAWRLADRFAGYMPYRGLVLPASRIGDRSEPLPQGVFCREMALQELVPYASDRAYDLGARFLSEAGDRGDCCIAVFAGQTLVSYSFNARIPTNIDAQFRYEFPPGWVYHFKAFTHPQWRGRKLHGFQMADILRRFRPTAGFKGLTTLVAATNYASLASFAGLNFEPAFRFTIVGKGAERRVVGWRRCGQVNVEGFAVAKTGQ